MTKTNFPKGFYWGASTASHQVEGETDTDWDEWERAHDVRSPRITKRLLGRQKNWSEIREQANRPDTYIAGRAVDHYNHYAEDFTLLKELNMNAFRFSIEWSRIEPREGAWNKAEIAHYRAYLEKLRAMGIEPFVTLWHFTSPRWFMELGGFTKKANVEYFTRYVQKLTEELGDLLSFVIPLNEPNTYVTMSYLTGLWPPQKHNIFTAYRVYKNLAQAHREAHRVLKRSNPKLQVGAAVVLMVDKLKSQSFIARAVRSLSQRYGNHWFLDRTRTASDFVGVNYYFTNYYRWYGGLGNPKYPKSDLGWYMEPKAIETLLVDIYGRYKLPIYITENGLADSHDQFRRWWIDETIRAMQGALGRGVDLRGYLHWSLLDNFEWAFGWLAEFGLVHVDRTTMKRTIRPSAKWFGEEIAKQRANERAKV